jgi:hypothetical protein
MNKGQKVALRHAANAIDGTRPATGHVQLGAGTGLAFTVDRHNRPFTAVYLAKRAGRTPTSGLAAQAIVACHYGLSTAQVVKLEAVAASTHNIKQRAERVARFLRRVAQDPTYVGVTRQPTTGAVAATL